MEKTKTYKEIFRLPIIVTKRDLEIEMEYLDFYNEEYWEKYKKDKLKKYDNQYSRSSRSR